MNGSGLALFAGSLAVAALAGKPILNGLIAMKSRQSIHKDAPTTHQVKAGTPTMGGLIILAGALPGLGWAATTSPLALSALILLFGFGLIGFVDDYVVPRMMQGKRGLGWTQKLLLQILFGSGALWATGIREPVALGLGLFFILFFCNAYNFSDGLDGLAGSLALWLLIGFAWLNPATAPVVLPLLAGILVFLYFNAPPARVFMGDVGALAIGAVLGLLFVQSALVPMPTDGSLSAWLGVFGSPTFAAFAVLSVVMIAELVPVPLQIFWVKVFKKRLFPFTPIHHAFEKAGWPETRVVFLFNVVQVACLIFAVLLAGGMTAK